MELKTKKEALLRSSR